MRSVPGLVALFASSISACAATPPSTTEPITEPSANLPVQPAPAASSAAGPALPAPAEVASTPPEIIAVRYEQDASSERAVSVIVEQLGFREVVGAGAKGELCSATVAHLGRSFGTQDPPLVAGIVTCPSGGAHLVQEDGALRIVIGKETHQLPLPANAKVKLPTSISRASSRVCPPGPIGKPVDVFLERVPVPSGAAVKEAELHVRIPSLQVLTGKVDWTMMSRCNGRLYDGGVGMSGWCSVGLSTAWYRAFERDGVVEIIYGQGSADEERRGPKTDSTAAFELPCGTHARFHPMPSTGTRVASCENRCQSTSDRCTDACYFGHSNDEEELDDAGSECSYACTQTMLACDERCHGGGSKK